MQRTHLSEMFGRLQSRLRAVGYAILGREDDVDDALQETFSKLWSRRVTVEHADNLEAYTVRAMRNECLDVLRRQAASPVTVPIEQCAEICSDEGDTEEIYRQVMAIVDSRLTGVQQQVLRMRDVKGMTYQDIADCLQLDPATVRVHLSRARKAVRTIYLQRQSQ